VRDGAGPGECAFSLDPETLPATAASPPSEQPLAIGELRFGAVQPLPEERPGHPQIRSAIFSQR
jgi:hypothetical protein